jgi:hypothetical protein
MCEPVTIGLMSAGLALTAGGMSAAAEYKDSKAREDQAKDNARLADRAAADARERGLQEGERYLLELDALLAETTAGYAAAGVTADKGSALDVYEHNRRMGMLDLQTIRQNAEREAFGFEAEAAQLRKAADYEAETRPMRVAGTILGGVSQGVSMGAGAMGHGGGGRRAGGSFRTVRTPMGSKLEDL